ncbi:MAG: hypothetical protein ACTHKB_15685 [Burkholderiaceae bacterium]
MCEVVKLFAVGVIVRDNQQATVFGRVEEVSQTLVRVKMAGNVMATMPKDRLTIIEDRRRRARMESNVHQQLRDEFMATYQHQPQPDRPLFLTVSDVCKSWRINDHQFRMALSEMLRIGSIVDRLQRCEMLFGLSDTLKLMAATEQALWLADKTIDAPKPS